MRNWILTMAACCCLPAALAQSSPDKAVLEPTQPQLQRELLDLRQSDQDALNGHQMTAEQLRALQEAHTRRLKDIVAVHGWPTLSMVGNDAAQGAWLLVQHADGDHAWQRQALGMMEALVPSNEVRKPDIAYLRDRLDVADHLPQRYGTQGHCVANSKWAPFPLAEPEQVEARRRAMDMSTLDAYVAMASTMLCKDYGLPPSSR
jgi:hypothetical protein